MIIGYLVHRSNDEIYGNIYIVSDQDGEYMFLETVKPVKGKDVVTLRVVDKGSRN